MKKTIVILYAVALAWSGNANWWGAFDDNYFAVHSPATSGEWIEGVGLPAASKISSSAVLGGYLYSTPGYTKTNVYRFDGTSWAEVAGSLWAGGLNGNFAVSVGNNIYLSQQGTNFAAFDGANWERNAALPSSQRWIIGDQTGRVFAIYPTKTNRYFFTVGGTNWQAFLESPSHADFGTTARLGDDMYYMAGQVTNFYRLRSNVWDQLPGNPGTNRYYNTIVAHAGFVYLIGGSGRANGLDGGTNVYKFDPASGVWAEVNGLPEKRIMTTAQSYNGKIYCWGSYQDGDPRTNVFIYE